LPLRVDLGIGIDRILALLPSRCWCAGDRLETALAKSQEDYAELEKLKDKEEVKASSRRTAGSEALKSEFDDLIPLRRVLTCKRPAKCKRFFEKVGT
jgi:hypothetical protein